MRRWLRVPVAALTTLSLLLWLATCALWVRSYAVEDIVIWRRVDGARWAQSARGSLIVGLDLLNWSGWPTDAYGLNYSRTTPPSTIADSTVGMYLLSIGPRDTCVYWDWAGFNWMRWQAAGSGSSRTRLVIPLWSVAAATVLPSIVWMTFHCCSAARRRRRAHLGRCSRCGCDLRATPDRCPECGTTSRSAMPGSPVGPKASLP